MNKSKKFISFVLAFIVLATSTVPALAASSSATTITQFAYIIFDKDGNVRETGVTPKPNARYSWDGIILDNGEAVWLLQTDKRAFSIVADTSTYLTITLNRNATIYYTLYKGSSDCKNKVTVFGEKSQEARGFGIPRLITETRYYWYEIENVSSDRIIIESASFTF